MIEGIYIGSNGKEVKIKMMIRRHWKISGVFCFEKKRRNDHELFNYIFNKDS